MMLEDELKQILEVLDNRDEDKALILIRKDEKLTKNMKLTILRKSIENQLDKVYKLFDMTIWFKNILYNEFKDNDSYEILKFLDVNDFFDGFVDHIICNSRNKTLFKVIFENKKHNDIVGKRVYDYVCSNNHDELMFYVEQGLELFKGTKVSNGDRLCEKFMGKNENDKIKELYERGLFKQDMDRVFFQCILLGRDELVNFFIEKERMDIEKVKKESKFIEKMFQFSEDGLLTNLMDLLKYKPNINTKDKYGADIVEVMQSVRDIKRNSSGVYHGIAKSLLEHTSEQNMIYNFTGFIEFLNEEDIKEMYNEYRLDFSLLKGNNLIFKDKDIIVLLLDLDDNFIDFIKSNLNKIYKHCSKDVKLYIETLV